MLLKRKRDVRLSSTNEVMGGERDEWRREVHVQALPFFWMRYITFFWTHVTQTSLPPALLSGISANHDSYFYRFWRSYTYSFYNSRVALTLTKPTVWYLIHTFLRSLIYQDDQNFSGTLYTSDWLTFQTFCLDSV